MLDSVDSLFLQFVRSAKEQLGSTALKKKFISLGGLDQVVRLCYNSLNDEVLTHSACVIGMLAQEMDSFVQSRVQSCGCIAALVAVCRRGKADGCLEAAIVSLRILSKMGEEGDLFQRVAGAEDGVEIVSELLRRCQKEQSLIELVGLLFSLTFRNSQNQLRVGHARGVEALVNICSKSKRIALLEGCVAVLCNLLMQEDNRKRMMATEGASCLVKLCGVQQSPLLLGRCSRALSNFMTSHAMQTQVSSVGGAEALVGLARSAPNEEVLEQVMAALCNLTFENDANRDKIGEIGGAEAIVHVIRTCQNSESVLRHAIAAVGNITKKNRRNRFLVGEASGCEALVQILRCSRSQPVLEQTPRALGNVAMKNEANAIKTCEAGGAEELTSLLSQSNDESVIRSTLFALTVIGEYPSCIQRLARIGGANPLIHLERSSSHEDIRSTAIRLLQAMQIMPYATTTTTTTTSSSSSSSAVSTTTTNNNNSNTINPNNNNNNNNNNDSISSSSHNHNRNFSPSIFTSSPSSSSSSSSYNNNNNNNVSIASSTSVLRPLPMQPPNHMIQQFPNQWNRMPPSHPAPSLSAAAASSSSPPLLPLPTSSSSPPPPASLSYQFDDERKSLLKPGMAPPTRKTQDDASNNNSNTRPSSANSWHLELENSFNNELHRSLEIKSRSSSRQTNKSDDDSYSDYYDDDEMRIAAASRPASGEQVYVQTFSGSWVRAGNATLALVDGPTTVSPAFAKALRLERFQQQGQDYVILKLKLLDREISVNSLLGEEGSPDIQMGEDLQIELEKIGVEPTIRPDFGDQMSSGPPSGSVTPNASSSHHSQNTTSTTSAAAAAASTSNNAAATTKSSAKSSWDWPEFMRMDQKGSWHKMVEEDDQILFAV